MRKILAKVYSRKKPMQSYFLLSAEGNNIRSFLDTDVQKEEEEKYWQKSTHGHMTESAKEK